MPHKRAKRSVREKQLSQSGLDLAPGARNAIEHEEIPKSVARVLNATKVQQEFREKRKAWDGGEETEEKAHKKIRKDSAQDVDVHKNDVTMKIKPGESMAHFNRRVEDAMRGDVRIAMKKSSTFARKMKKDEEGQRRHSKPDPKQKTTSSGDAELPSDELSKAKLKVQEKGPRDFERKSTSTPRRLNDIVQAPPELKKLPRGAKAGKMSSAKESDGATLRQGALSMAQKAMLEEERVRAVQLYRDMKKAKMGGG